MMKTTKIGVLGAGNWGQNYLKILNKTGVLAALADPEESVRNKFKDVYPQIEVTGDYREILKNPKIQAVIVATPAVTHYQITKDALLAGKDVLLEKPMALKVEEALELVELARDLNRVLVIGHLLLYKPAIEKIMEIINSQVIGELLFVEMRRLKLGKVRNQENVLWSFAPHDVAVLLALVCSKVIKVTATGQDCIQSQVEDDVYLHMDFANKVKGHIHISWLWPENERKTIVVGTKGMLVYDEILDQLKLYSKGVNSELEIWDAGSETIFFESADVLEKEVSHFLECINNRSVPIATSGKAGIEVVKVLVEATASLKSSDHSKEKFFAHPSAVIDPPVKIGQGTQIWHFSHIMKDAEIGMGCKIGQNVVIASGAKLGNNVKIQNNVSVYEGVILEDDVFCGPSMVFTNVNTPRSGFPRNTSADYEMTLVKEGASIGANATIVCGTTIGKYGLVGAGSVVTKDVPDHALVYGNPAKINGWVCKCGEVRVREAHMILHCDYCETEIMTCQI